MSNNIVRGTVTVSHSDKKCRTLQVSLQAEEVRDNLEHLEPYGFTSEPYTDKKTDAICLFLDDSRGHGVVIAVGDRRFRLQNLQKGEVALYDDQGKQIYFKRDKLYVDSVDKPIEVKTTSTVTINATQVTINGNVQVNGTINATQDIKSATISMQGHTHRCGSGNTDVPNR